jgi:hypothetical protein
MELLNGEGELAAEEIMRAAISVDGGRLVVDPACASECFFGKCDADVARWAIERLHPQSIAGFAQAPTRAAWRQRPTTYILCREDRALAVAAQRLLAQRTDRVYELDSDHSPFLSCPDALSDLLREIAGGPV